MSLNPGLLEDLEAFFLRQLPLLPNPKPAATRGGQQCVDGQQSFEHCQKGTIYILLNKK